MTFKCSRKSISENIEIRVPMHAAKRDGRHASQQTAKFSHFSAEPSLLHLVSRSNVLDRGAMYARPCTYKTKCTFYFDGEKWSKLTDVFFFFTIPKSCVQQWALMEFRTGPKPDEIKHTSRTHHRAVHAPAVLYSVSHRPGAKLH